MITTAHIFGAQIGMINEMTLKIQDYKMGQGQLDT
jgi:hypothetical protein